MKIMLLLSIKTKKLSFLKNTPNTLLNKEVEMQNFFFYSSITVEDRASLDLLNCPTNPPFFLQIASSQNSLRGPPHKRKHKKSYYYGFRTGWDNSMRNYEKPLMPLTVDENPQKFFGDF